MYVWVVCTKKSSYCHVYSTKALAIAWMLHGMPNGYDWRLDYRLIETEVCDSKPEEYMRPTDTLS